jgi:alpha-beta hydrolase superfamily lysophospholipase
MPATGLRDVLTGLALSSGIGYAAAAYTASRWLTHPTPGTPRQTPSDHGFAWDCLHCRTADRHRLAGWVVTPPEPRATVVLFHGVHHNREQTLDRTAFLAAAGYRCVAFDHRAHGESTGRRTSFGYHESRDVIAVLDLVRHSWPRQRYAALGISMGAAALCYAADAVRNSAAVVLESLYHDVASAFASRLAGYPPWFRRLSRGAVWVTERRLGLRLAQLTPAEHIGKLAPAAVLLVTGSDDAHAPPADAHRLWERCRGPRELCIVPHAGHRNLFEIGGPLYQQRVLEFLGRWVL